MITNALHIRPDRAYALVSSTMVTMEVHMRKMTVRRTSTLRLLSGARRLWIEWCW
ncbi:hypothetical protein GA0070563_109111 [Micromonospora carbonacea]|uniref:Uncharacterized protein n=1 Tax=Micromonospora carbonacea TaxID=47853 RepID=A0A1C4ZQR8_9ACTN|nr:hypothetical protein GA0070563_109111 [Micromonospora carbonacea]